MIKVNDNYIQEDVENIISELKRQLAINGIQRFAKTIDTPNNTMTCCPFHNNGQERKPSFGISKSDGVCHCFSCGYVGSLSEMISNCFGYDDWGVFGSKWLVKNFLTISIETRKDIDLNCERKTNSISHNNNFVTEEELESYRYYHPYWAKRKITDKWLIELFDLGYDDNTKCITMPNRDLNGNCVFVARRSVNTKYFNYPNGVEKPLYGAYEIYKDIGMYDTLLYDINIPSIYVCESMIDALTVWEFGGYAVALNGLGTKKQFKQLRELPCRELIIATDNDSAGISARENIKKNVTNKILKQIILPPNKKDINDLSETEFRNCQITFL